MSQLHNLIYFKWWSVTADILTWGLQCDQSQSHTLLMVEGLAQSCYSTVLYCQLPLREKKHLHSTVNHIENITLNVINSKCNWFYQLQKVRHCSQVKQDCVCPCNLWSVRQKHTTDSTQKETGSTY